MPPSITAQNLALQLASATPPTVIDVRRDTARANNPHAIAQAPWYNPALWLDWKDQIGTDKPVVVYCAFGHEIGQGLCTTLRALGVEACYLDGGISAWQAAGLPTNAVQISG